MNFEQVPARKAFLFLTEAVDPDGLEAEGGRSANIPGIRGEKEDFPGFGLEALHGQLVDPWIGFEDTDTLHDKTASRSSSRRELHTPEKSFSGDPLERTAVP